MKSTPSEHPTTISACMMVKNEEEMLPNCLESIKDVVDELIVVDTGSTDRTIEIAESYGAKIYHHPWENDFSKHRNQSISYATGDWFLIIDADEILVTENLSVPKLKKRLSELNPNVHAILATVWDYDKKGNRKLSWKSSRLFRNHVGVHYEGYVHNQTVVKGKAVDSPLVMNHYGYDLSPEKMKKKFERTDSLLQNRIQVNPADYEAYFYLANLYGGHKRYEEAVDYGKKMLEHLPEGESGEIFLKIYYNIAAANANLKLYDAAIDWCHQGLERLPDDIDLHYLMIKIGLLTKDVALMRKHAELFLRYHEEWSQKNMKAGFRFVYHLDTQHKNSSLAHYITAVLAETADEAVTHLEETYRKQMMNNPEIVSKVVEDLARMEMDECLLLNIFPLLELTTSPGESLKPLLNRLNENPQITEDFLKQYLEYELLSEDHSLFSTIIDQLINGGLISQANELLEHVSALNIPAEIIIAKKARLSIIDGETDQTMRLVKQGMALNVNDQEFYLAAIPFLYQHEKTVLIWDALERVLLYYDSFGEMPDHILLILSHRLIENQEVEYLAQVTDALCRRFEIPVDQEVESWRDFAEIYNSIGQHLVAEDKHHMAQIAWEAGFAMTRNGEYLAKIADTFYAKGRYDRALSLYANALNHNHQSQHMIEHMKAIFEEVNDSAGIEQCEQLLSVYNGSE